MHAVQWTCIRSIIRRMADVVWWQFNADVVVLFMALSGASAYTLRIYVMSRFHGGRVFGGVRWVPFHCRHGGYRSASNTGVLATSVVI